MAQYCVQKEELLLCFCCMQNTKWAHFVEVCPCVFQHNSEIISYISVKKNSVALVRERTIPTERPQFVGEVGAKFCG
jgi:hypothetical protein